MATKKPAPKKSTSAKTTKTAAPAKTSSKTATTKTTKPTKTVTKSTSTSSSAKTSPKKSTGRGRVIATVIGIIAAVALVIVTIVCLANNINKNGKNNLTVVDGDGKKITTEYIGFEDEAFRLKIPTSFKSMTNEEIEKKYGKENAPKIVYANDTDDVNIAINPTDSPIANDQIETYLNTMKSVLSVGGEVLSTNLFTQGNHNLATMQIVTDGEDTKYYNEMMFFSLEGNLGMVNFNCKNDQRQKWQPVSEFIMKSIDFTK